MDFSIYALYFDPCAARLALLAPYFVLVAIDHVHAIATCVTIVMLKAVGMIALSGLHLHNFLHFALSMHLVRNTVKDI